MKSMAKSVYGFKVVVGVIVLPLILSACQKNGDAGVEAGTSLETLSCPSGQYKSSGDAMMIQGASQAGVGENVEYQLNNDALCSGAQKVEWNMSGTANMKATGGTVVTQYSVPGEYYVVAKLTGASASAELAQKTTIVGEQIQFSGPQVTSTFRNNTFSLNVPSGTTLISAHWDFGDGTQVSSSTTTVEHIYTAPGEYLIRVIATDNANVVTVIEHMLTVIVDSDEIFCANQLLVSVPTQTMTNVDNAMSVYLPACLQSYLTGVTWDFGDGASGSGQNVQKKYADAGDYSVRITVHLNYFALQQIRITRNIQVNAAPVDNNKCSTLGQTREVLGASYVEAESCGVSGKKDVTYQNRRVETCDRVADILDWVLTSEEKIKLSEGDCKGQSCPLPGTVPVSLPGVQIISGQPYLVDGGSITFYTQSLPQNSCEQNQVIRSCSNGVLSGSTAAILYQCTSGCGDFGPNGTVKVGEWIGNRQVPVQCQFGEQGIFDLYNEIEDRSCVSGSVINSNQRLGALITKGQCPGYSYQPTNLYTACNADCGGMQTRIFECRNNAGEKVDNSRCAGQVPPVVTRVCDGNPEAVRRTEVVSEAEQIPSQNKCPSNQIGTIVKNRDLVTTKKYACIHHSVALESTDVTYTPWVEERYCRDYVAHRCSQDSLNNTDAKGRMLWMKRCAPQVPAIAEFLENFDDIKVNGVTIDTTTRLLYPTFMNSAKRPESVWKAPTKENASCVVPEGVYIAAVCVSSCALPQEKILAQPSRGQKLSAVEFIEALTKNYERVGTLSKNSAMDDRRLKSSKVEQWITELIDTEQPVLVFKMQSGNTLSVTPNHPLLRKDGTMVTADQFKSGEALVKLGGELDPIVEIENILYYGKVYNLFVKSSIPQENIVVTNGYLNGSAFFQNEGAGELNKTLLRKKLTRGIFTK
jgi:PKD repeat protein